MALVDAENRLIGIIVPLENAAALPALASLALIGD
jgi:hypothetical protein